MAEDIIWNDDEKVEQIKKWWKKYGNHLITVVIAVMVVIVGWQYWQRHTAKINEQASIAYENVIGSEQADPSSTANLAQQVIQQFPSTPYASYAAFILADQAVTKADYAQATTQLQWVVDHAKAKNINQLARVRLARVLLAQQQPQKALEVLDTTVDVFPGLAATVRGDAYSALNNAAQARTAYQEALKALPQQSALWNLVNMKLNDLPASN